MLSSTENNWKGLVPFVSGVMIAIFVSDYGPDIAGRTAELPEMAGALFSNKTDLLAV